MFKLNGEQAQEAWEDYKGFMDSMGMKLMPGVEQAFKMGFAMAQANQKKQDPVVTLDGKSVVNQVKEKNHSGVKRRTEQQRIHDTKLVADILKRNGEMNGQEVCEAMNKAGADWYYKSVHGHMRLAMERDPKILKVGSLYRYVDNVLL